MELDFKTVKALSSPTRLKILNKVIHKESTPTGLSKEVGKSKSTVASHLSKLESSGLVKKESEEGRKRVVYSPTKKAEAVVKEKEKKVKFSIVSSTVTGIAGLGFLGASIIEKGSSSTTSEPEMMLQAEAAKAAGNTATGGPENVFLFLGAGFLTISISAIVYGLFMNRLTD